MTTKQFPIPDFASMTNAQIIEAYNDLNSDIPDFKPRKAAFPGKDEGVARCQASWKTWAKANPETPEDKAARIEAAKVARAAEKEARAAAKPAKAEKKAKVQTNGAGGTKGGLEDTIKVLAPQNPYREGTVSRKMFEVMQKYSVVGDYLDHAAKHSKVAEENRRKDAGVWLGNAVRAGHVERIKA